MAVTLLNPEGLPKTDILHQVSVATGSKMVFIAGQVAWDAEGRTVGEGDFAAQVEQCFLNVATALAEVGGSVEVRVGETWIGVGMPIALLVLTVGFLLLHSLLSFVGAMRRLPGRVRASRAERRRAEGG